MLIVNQITRKLGSRISGGQGIRVSEIPGKQRCLRDSRFKFSNDAMKEIAKKGRRNR
jgi:hypothetical protein